MSGPSGAEGGVSEGAAAVLDGMDDGVDVGVPFEPMDESSSEDDDDDDDIDDSITADESGSEVSDGDDNEGEGEGYGDSDDDDNDSDECSSEMEPASNVDENGEIVRTTLPLAEDRDDDAADRAAEHAEQGPPEHWEARLDESSGIAGVTTTGSLVRQQRPRDSDADEDVT